MPRQSFTDPTEAQSGVPSSTTPPRPPLTITAMQTAGVAVVLKAREISFIGVVLLMMVLLLLVVLRTASRAADAKSKLVRKLAEKADAWYIDNGKVCGDYTWFAGHMLLAWHQHHCRIR